MVSTGRPPTEATTTTKADDGALQEALGRYTQATMVQIAQNVVCNSSHAAVQRAARWLLTARDRIGGEKFLLTQEFLAQLLGVRRQPARMA